MARCSSVMSSKRENTEQMIYGKVANEVRVKNNGSCRLIYGCNASLRLLAPWLRNAGKTPAQNRRSCVYASNWIRCRSRACSAVMRHVTRKNPPPALDGWTHSQVPSCGPDPQHQRFDPQSITGCLKVALKCFISPVAGWIGTHEHETTHTGNAVSGVSWADCRSTPAARKLVPKFHHSFTRRAATSSPSSLVEFAVWAQ